MRIDAPVVSPSGASAPKAPAHPLSFTILVSASPGIVLVWTQIWAAFAILVWAIGHYLVPGPTGELIVAAVLIVPVVVLSVRMAKAAIKAEIELAADAPGHSTA